VSVATGLDAVTVLRSLLSTPSPTGAVDRAAESLMRIADEAGFLVRRDQAGNVLMTWGRDVAGGDVILLGHLDTVPGDLAVHEEAGRLHGRGAVDAKGPLAAALAAVSRLRPDDGRAVSVIAACDEEGASHGAQHLRHRAAPAHLVVLEPSGWDTITTGYRGCLRLEATVTRPAAHHAGPEPGAPDRLVGLLADLRTRVTGSAGRAVDRLQLRVNTLHAVEDGSSDRASAGIELRLPSGTSVDQALDIARRTLDGAELVVQSACEAVSVARSNPTARALARAISSAGARPRYTTKTGTSDLNVVLPAWGCPAAVYGPGDCSLDHGPVEWQDIEDLRRGTDVLESTVRALR
jgi:LysW-gamma-L-lysine carboxypeptidase